MEQIKLDMIPKGITPIAHASQYDQGRLIHFILMDNLQAFILTDETVMIKVCKPDNNIVTGEATYTANTNIVTISTTEQMTAVAGDSKCELSITKNNIKVGSLNFILRVEEDPLKDGVESETVIANLDTIIDNAVSEALNDTVLYGAYPTAEIDNVPIASFSDGADDVPVKALQIGINAIQEGTGTPSPDNIRPISGFTGANIYDKGANLWNEVVEEGYINNSGTPTANANSLRSKNFLPCTPNTAYYCYISEDVIGGLAVCWYDINQTFISRDNQTHNVTSPANARFFKLSLYNYKNYYPSYANNVSLNYPATDTAYHAYNANSHTTAITWQDEAGTVYGGSLDVTSGVLTVTHGIFDLGSKSWSFNSGGQGRWVCTGINTIVKIPSTQAIVANIICSHYQSKTAQNIFGGQLGIAINTDGNIWIHDPTYDSYTPTDFKTAMNGVTLAYELATPVTYQLTPTQINTIVGTNNVFTDTGDIQNLIYRRDMNSIVEAIPAPPSTDGTYSLKCTVSGGVASYSWVAD